MRQDPAAGPERPFALALLALVAAASAFVLPAADASLPGGAIVWQLLALAVAVAAAWRAYRAAGSPASASVRGRRLVRVVAGAAVVLALAWLGGVATLWLIWPR